jgi:SAM-dependent methyltransferase
MNRDAALDVTLSTPDVSQRIRAFFGPYMGPAGATRLNLGCGRAPEPGFVNVDKRGGAGADVVFDLEACGYDAQIPLPGNGGPENPFPDDSVDAILASHVLEHIWQLIPLMRELHRVLKVGGHLCIVVPYASSDDAVEDPTHVRFFTERSFMYFDKRLYEKPDHAGSYPSDIDFAFDVVKTTLVPYPDLQLGAGGIVGQQAELQVKKRFMRNVIREIHAVLQKVEA